MKKILAIDDQQDNLVTIKALLNINLPEYTVITASSGVEGIMAAQNEQPDVILLDIKMPNMDGYEVCENLKKKEQTKRIPIIMLTAVRTDTASRVKALDLGADAFLLKPIDSVELIAQVHVMLRIKKAEDKLIKENIELEELVKERTLELSEKNNILNQEIAQREKLTQKLIESESKYKALYINAPLAYQSLDAEGNIKDVNPTWLSILGYQRNQVIGKSFFCFLHPESHKKAETKIFPEFKSSGFIHNVEFKIRHENGNYIDISYEGCAEYNLNGSFKQTYCVFQDITERKKAEEALAQEQRFTQTLMDSMPGIFYLYTYPEMQLVRWNKNHETVFGYSHSELENMNINDWIHEESKQIVINAVQKIINNGFLSLELELYTKTRKAIPFILSSVKFETQNQQYILGVGIDNSKQKLAEEAKVESERKLKTLVNNLQGIAYRCKNDRNWTMEYLSQGFEQLTGYKTEDIVNNNKLSFTSLIVSEDQNQVREKVQLAINKKEPFELTYKIKTASGSIVHVLEKGVGVYSEKNGKLIALEGFITDISEGIKTTKELFIHNKRLEALLKILQHGFDSTTQLLDFALDQAINLTESKFGYIFFYNEKKQQFTLYAWSQDAKMQCNVDNQQTMYQLENTGCWGEAVRQRKPFIINDYSKPNEFIKGTPQGHVILKKFLTVPIIVNNEIKLVIGVANKNENYTDTDSKQLTLLMDSVWNVIDREQNQNELIKAKQRAEESDQLKSAFLANMSHEIRTPMNAVLGFSQLLLKENIEPHEKIIYSEYIRINGESLVKIIDDIIDISKIQIKQLSIRKVDFNLHLIIEELHVYYTRLLAQSSKNIVFKLDISNNLNEKFFVNSDDSRLKQIFNNLISNAIKYTDQGEIIFGYKELDKKIHFYIKDTGYGISKENQTRIFERFFQHSNKYVSRQEGTGLGLAISKELVELLGGELKVDSVLGEGSMFYFDLPVEHVFVDRNEIPVHQTHEKVLNLSAYKLLIVDDEESNYVLTKRILKHTKIQTEWASNGKDAVEMVKKNTYNIVIMDIKMPEMDGIEATRLIKQYNKNTVVIIQTAFAMPETKEEAFAAGCDDLVVKPITAGNFMALIQKHLV